MKECYLYKKFPDKSVECQACNQRCRISIGKRGICGVRENKLGKLNLLTYGLACAEQIDPIEKKPLYHFLPHTKTLTVATVGCNFRCKWCQNWDISQSPKSLSEDKPPTVEGLNLAPEKIVEDALKNNCPSISYSYTEPTVYMDYALDTMKLARKAKLKNIWVSNGYMTKECLNMISPYLDAVNIDIKSLDKKKFSEYIGAVDPSFVIDSCKYLVKKKIHLEITTLIVPFINDSPKELTEISKTIHDELGASVPWHLSRYFPCYKYNEPATPIETLKKAEEIGKKIGLKNIHLGNI